jgi:hypothetical protein
MLPAHPSNALQSHPEGGPRRAFPLRAGARQDTSAADRHVSMRQIALLVLTLGLTSPRALAAPALFSLAIGHNGLPLDAPLGLPCASI